MADKKTKEVKVIAMAFPDLFSATGPSDQEKAIEEVILKYAEDDWTLAQVGGGYAQLILVFTK
jgi:hypothetical protein